MDFLLRACAAAAVASARNGWPRSSAADPRRLVFTANVTAAINIVAAGLMLAAPGEILLTDHEYGAMHWCWERAAQRLGLDAAHFPFADRCRRSPTEIVDALRGRHDATDAAVLLQPRPVADRPGAAGAASCVPRPGGAAS